MSERIQDQGGRGLQRRQAGREGAVSETPARDDVLLSDRQRGVLRALVAAYVAGASPVGSASLSDVLPERLSSASVRNTLAELTELGLIDKPHASSGRVPTESGLRLFVDQLLDRAEIAASQRRRLDRSFDDAGPGEVLHVASRLLSDQTRQLGFGLAPRLERVIVQHVTLVRLSSERLLAVLIATNGRTFRCVLSDAGGEDQRQLDAMASALNERIAGRTLAQVRERLEREVAELRSRADAAVGRALAIGLQVVDAELRAPEVQALVISTHLALLDQPEFGDPGRLRELYAEVEEGERLLSLLGELLDGDGVTVSLGAELASSGLTGCALVAAPYAGLGVLGVIGPARMDYGRIIPLVSYCSERVAEKLA